MIGTKTFQIQDSRSINTSTLTRVYEMEESKQDEVAF